MVLAALAFSGEHKTLLPTRSVGDPPFKRHLWYVIGGTRGGPNRARIIQLLCEKPLNANQLASELRLHYKTVAHHLSVMVETGILVSSGQDTYGTLYFLSARMEANIEVFQEIWGRIRQTQK